MSISFAPQAHSKFRQNKSKNIRIFRIQNVNKNGERPYSESNPGRIHKKGADFSRLEAVLASTPDAPMTTTTEGQIHSFGKRTEKFLGDRHRDAIGRNIEQLFEAESDALNKAARCRADNQEFHIYYVKNTKMRSRQAQRIAEFEREIASLPRDSWLRTASAKFGSSSPSRKTTLPKSVSTISGPQLRWRMAEALRLAIDWKVGGLQRLSSVGARRR